MSHSQTEDGRKNIVNSKLLRTIAPSSVAIPQLHWGHFTCRSQSELELVMR